MDKNMISIDDLVKQRLKGGEEQERPGAWLHMKELLDDKMPTRVPVAFNWRRMMSYMAAALALSAIGIGGYKAISSMHNTANDKGIAAAAHTAANSTTPNKPANDNGSNAAVVATAGTDNKANEDQSTANNTRTITKNELVNTTKTEGQNKKNSIAVNATNKLDNNNLANNNLSNTTNNTTVNTNTASNKIVPASGNSNKHNSVAVTNKPGKNKAASTNTTANNNLNTVAVKEQTANKNTAPDSIPSISVSQKMTIDHRTNEAHYTQEVTGIGKAPAPVMAPRPANSIATAENNYNNPRYVASAANGQVIEVAQNTEIRPAAAVETKAATENKNLGLASTHKARKSSGWNFDAVNQFFKDVKYNLGQVTYKTGITGGVNANFMSGYVLPGFQIGATETLVLSDRVSLLFELKYSQVFNRGMVLHDNYIQYKEEADHTWTRDSVVHYFNFSTFQNFNLPITVHYNIGNFNILAGGAATYTLSVNADDGGGKVPPHAVVAKPTQEEIDRTASKINAGNFNARFGLGYVFGLSYQVSPKLSVDARMTQTIWDNAKTPGAKVVSEYLYKKPGVQLSVGYDLSGNKKR